jgi:peptidoglycan/LPS O-acetylase OafA/YrhL
MSIAEREIVLGVSGGIAAYKAAALASTLVQRGAGVTAVLTRNARRFIGAATFAAEGMQTRLGARWPLLLPAAAVLFVGGVATIGLRPAAAVLQPAYAWTMSLGLIGLFHRFFPHPSSPIAWLADATYWMYLAHVPLVLAAQLAVREWPLPGEVKFLLILVILYCLEL